MLVGIAASAGVSVGKAHILRQEPVQTTTTRIHEDEIDRETEKLEQSVAHAYTQIEVLRDEMESTLGPEQAAILSAHLAFLEDPGFVGEMKKLIATDHIDAASAVQQIVSQFSQLFEDMDDEYMRERAADIRDVGKRIMNGLLGKGNSSVPEITEPVILIAEDLTPSDTVQMPKGLVKGIVAATGGATSHAAILARAMGIPAVLGVGSSLLASVAAGDMVIVDGNTGQITINPDAEAIEATHRQIDQYRASLEQLQELRDVEAITLDGHRILTKGNIGSPTDLEWVLDKGADGIGLFRSEFLYMHRDSLPTEEEQFQSYQTVAEQMEGKPVIIRTLDIGGDKHLPYLELPKEMNPFLGYRAIRISLDRLDMFKTQLRAILRASAYGKIYIMFPMISHVEQVRQAKQVLHEVQAELRETRVPFDEQIQVGIMIEIPSACVIADVLASEVDFFSVGTNDLVQYTLAVDRMNERLGSLYDHFHPAIIRLLKMVTDAARQKGIWVGVCGEMASDPLATELLVGLGIVELSTSPNSILAIKKNIRSISYQGAQQTALHALTLATGEEVRVYLQAQIHADK